MISTRARVSAKWGPARVAELRVDVVAHPALPAVRAGGGRGGGTVVDGAPDAEETLPVGEVRRAVPDDRHGLARAVPGRRAQEAGLEEHHADADDQQAPDETHDLEPARHVGTEHGGHAVDEDRDPATSTTAPTARKAVR